MLDSGAAIGVLVRSVLRSFGRLHGKVRRRARGAGAGHDTRGMRGSGLAPAAAGDTIRDLEKLGTAARERTVAALHVGFDTTLARRLAGVWDAIPRPSRDSSLMAQIRTLGIRPRIAAADTGRVLARSSD